MNSPNGNEKPFVFRFLETASTAHLELTNITEGHLKSIEILTVFLRDLETPGGGPSQAHIRFEGIASIRPKESVELTHRTWINGKPATPDADQLGRLKVIPGQVSPYALDISWQDAGGKTRYQRVPVGH